MKETRHEENEKAVVDLKCQNILPEVEKSSGLSSAPLQILEIAGSEHLETKIVTLTPEKPNEPLHAKHKKQAAELPEKYRALSEFFDRMICSMRLLSLCKRKPTFENICSQVEVLTRRKFSYRHLAQIKFILPEAVQTDRILIHDEKTMCMKPDMKITLLIDVVEGHREQSTYIALHQEFDARLFNFFSTHPEALEIPEAELPEPFNGRSIVATTDSLPVALSTESLPNSSDTELLNYSHLHPSFTKHFSQRDGAAETGKTQLLASQVPLSSKATASGQEKTSPNSHSKSTVLTEPAQLVYPPCYHNSGACESTPMKIALEADNLMVETPAQLTPKRSLPSCDDKHKSVTSQKWMASNMSTKRSLDFSYLEGEESLLNSTADEIEQHDDIPKSVPQTEETKGILVKDDATLSAAPLPKVEESSWCTDKPLSACLSDLVAIINHIFQSANCSSITKEELMHKIIMNNCDIVESREVEEQMELLEKLVPDWICKKLTPSGDLLYNIKKVSDLSSVCERLISK
ncbi:hypothetical protein LguiA_027772 [Lonicera macranthoides]